MASAAMSRPGVNAAKSGRHRLQGRNPAAMASPAEGKNCTRSRRGGREGQEGRQKTPVEVTP